MAGTASSPTDKHLLKVKEYLNHLAYSPGQIGCFFGLLSFLLRIPFLFRYDLHFGGDSATCYLMALRILQGDRPVYFYGQDYQGTVEAYGAALLFKIFGPSIPLGGSVSLLEWSLAVGIGAYLLIRGTDKFHGILGGLVAAVGVPYTLHYVVVPYWGYPGSLLAAMLALLGAFFILDRGPSPLRFFLLGLTAGAGLYIGKQCVPGLAAAFIALVCLKSPSCNLRKPSGFLWPAMAALGFVLGYLPELGYRFSHPSSRNFTGMAFGQLIPLNFKSILKSIPAYFDAQPVSRIPEAVYYFLHDLHEWVYPKTISDVTFSLLGFVVLVFMLKSFYRAFFQKNAALLLLSLLVMMNMGAVLISQQTSGDVFNARRYLYSSAIAFSLWTGFFLAAAVGHKSRWFSKAVAILGVFFLGRVFYHEQILLRSPDELRELRWTIGEMESQGLNRGLADWGHAYIIDALTDQQIVVAGINGERIPEYAQQVSQADRIAVIGLKGEPIDEKISYGGGSYSPVGNPRENETFRWIPYGKQDKTNSKSPGG
jgi:hypothetical protein